MRTEHQECQFKLTREQFAELWKQKELNGGKTKFSNEADRQAAIAKTAAEIKQLIEAGEL